MKIRIIGLLILVTFFITGCDGTNPDYSFVNSGLTIDSEMVYYREYTNSATCDTFDVFPVYKNGEMYYYLEAYKSMSNACSSSLYVDTQEGYIDVYYGFNTGVYDMAQLNAMLTTVTPIYESYIVPSVVTLAQLQDEIADLVKAAVLNDALAIENAASLYCAATNCADGVTLTWADLGPYVNGIDTNDYDFTANGGVIADITGGVKHVFLERSGTGDWEVPQGGTPSILTTNDLLIDAN